MLHDAAFVFAGFVIGMLIAYSGVGAGALLTPLLVLTGVQASTAIGSDLLFALVTKVVAVVAHIRAKTIDRALLWRIGPAGIVGAICGVVLVGQLQVHVEHSHLERLLRTMLAYALIAAAAAIALRPYLVRSGDPSAPVSYPTMWLAVIGFGVGFVVSLTSIGAGSLTLPLLLVCVPAVAITRLVGTDIAFAVVLLVPSLIGHAALGNVNLPLTGLLLLGSIPGVFVGARIHARLPDRAFRFGMAGILTVVAAVMLVPKG
jgi:uncharacterized membrane protein YfcA